MKRKNIFILFFILIILGEACDQPEQVPAYIKVEPFEVSAPGGTGFQRITEAWVYVNNELLGAYYLPAVFPVLAEGDAEVQLFPGVKENGIAFTPAIYPLLQKHVQTLRLSPPDITTVKPSTNYVAEAKFAWDLNRSTFDGASSLVFENRDSDDQLNYILSDKGAFSGRSVVLEVNKDHPALEIASEAVSLPTGGGRQIWAELHHSNTVPFDMGLLGEKNTGEVITIPVFQFNSTDNQWNKIYFNLTDFVSKNPSSKYKLYFRIAMPVGATEAGFARLDNLRIIHF